MANPPSTINWRSIRSKLIRFQLIYHDGQSLLEGPITDLQVATTDPADVITCRVLKAFEMPGETHALMHFTAPQRAGKRVVPNYFGIHELCEVHVHVRMIERPGLEVVGAGVKRLGLSTEDDDAHDLKRFCVDGAGF